MISLRGAAACLWGECHDKRVDLWGEWHDKRVGLWGEWPEKTVTFDGSGLKRELALMGIVC